MAETSNNLGKLESVHGISSVYLQRAAIIAVLSLIFFMAMLIAFYVRQNIGYFVISSAFLIVYLFTLVSWIMQRRNVVKIFEKGIRYKTFEGRWNEIETATVHRDGTNKTHIEIKKGNHEIACIPSSIQEFDQITHIIQRKISLIS